MFNVTTKVAGKKLTIEVDLKGPGRPSNSGKTTIIASTDGNAKVAEAKIDGQEVSFGLNVWTKVQAKAATA